MDALILSCGTGGGHDSAARAIVEALRARGHRADMLNPYDLKSRRLANGINKTYVTTARNAPHVFGAVYKLGDVYRKLPFHSPVYFVNRGMNGTLQSYIEENHYDIVITTHLFPAEILTNMKRHGIDVPKIAFVATDYACIPFTEETECDAYVIPAADLADEFVKRGIAGKKLYPLGIPTSSKFSSLESREEARRRLKLDGKKKYILITGGSMGGGKIKYAIAQISSYFGVHEDVEIITVCGSNKALYEKLNEKRIPRMHVVGHTDEMASYMRACDIFITKPGGLSSTEAAVCGIPILHTSPIPGCESVNARYFSERGMSIYGSINSETLSVVSDILSSRDAGAEMTLCQKKYINASAAAEICTLAEEMTAGNEI